MEARKNTTAGVVFWTPAPVCTSPSSSVISEGEDEEETERGDDFVSQMDENGIIGLSEALGEVELEPPRCESNAGSDAGVCAAAFTLQEAEPSERERDPPEDRSYNLGKRWPHNGSQGEGVRIPSSFEDMMDMENKHRSASRATCSLAERFIPEGDIEFSTTQKQSAHPLDMGPASVSNRDRPISQPTSPAMAPTYRHLLHFTAEEMADAPGIDAETLPEMSFTESPPESLSSHVSHSFSPRCAEVKLRAPSQPAAAMSAKQGASIQYCRADTGPLKASDTSGIPHKQPTPSPRKMRQKSPESARSGNGSLSLAKADSLTFKHQTTSPDKEQETPSAMTAAAELDESRKGPLSYRTPDFTKVEPRVRFPKEGYNPPRSRRSCERKSLSPEPIFVFQSPAGIGKEVALNPTAGPPPSPHCPNPPTSAPNPAVPQELRGRQQAATLLDQLEKDYNKLLTKYAEAENTIDRLRLEAKVNLYSDPPKPGHLVQSGLNRDSSTYMKLDFPQAQRAAFNSTSLHPNGQSNHQKSSSACPSTRSPDPQVGQQLAKILYHQADKFLQQLQSFDDLLRSKTLRPFDQMKGLSQLAEGLNSLERGYLFARDEHKVLQQGGAQILPFDSERELEGLIFQCGLRMEELKEQPTCEAPPSPPPHPTPSPVPICPLRGTHPQSPPAAVEVSSAPEESDEEEETRNSLYLKPQNGKQRPVEQDFLSLIDHYQSFKELPSQRGRASLSAALSSDVLPGEQEGQRPGGLPQRKDKSNHLASAPVGSVTQQAIEPSYPSRRASSQSTSLHPLHPLSSSRRLELGKSHSSSLSSLGEVTASGKRNAKPQTGSTGGLSQDGVISPETDSGFVCSESSRPTPAAALSSLHQRAMPSVLVPQQGNPLVHPVPSTSHRHAAMEPRSDSQISCEQQRRRTSSCSLQPRARQTHQTRAHSGTSDLGLESERSHTASEDGLNDQYTESVSSLHQCSPSSSPTATHHHGDSLIARRSSQNRSDSIQRLQVEVIRLRDRLESCVRNQTPLSSVSPAAPAQENFTLHNTPPPCFRSAEKWGDVSRGRRDGRTVDEVDESTLRKMARKRPSSAHRQKPQLDILTGPEPSSPNPPPLVSRGSRSHSAVCSRTHPRHLGASETDSRGRPAPLCPQCFSCPQERSEIGGDKERVHSSLCRCCPLCGRPEPSRSTEPDCCRVSGSPAHMSCHVCSPDGAGRSRHVAAPPVLLHCMPVCPPPLLLFSSPPYVPPSHSTPSGVRGRREMRARRSQSSDRQHSVDTSLDRAIRAARHMKHTSGHMARSLTSGVQYQELLTQSCSY
ncbi:microtubule organization protein AKNA [Pungitius pungitius]|uniref:microtubule organization protein AKNA n=1 Tax=Pungitius pungitius TaxID=134920 RepID=UPI002E11FD37